MLQRLNNFLDEELGDGLWSRSELEEMDAAFVAAVEQAYAQGLESREAAAATVQIKSLNGKGAAIERAFESAWDLMVDRKGDVTALEVMAFMQTLAPGISPAHVRLGLEQRFKQRGVCW